MKPGSIRAPTLQTIADAAGVHRSTVSRALRDDAAHQVTPELLERIRSEARRVGYRPDPVAAGLRTKRSGLIGVIIPDISNPLFGAILHGIETELAPRSYVSIVANAGSTDERQLELVAKLVSYRIEGLLLATAQQEDRVLSFCLDRGVPAVLVNRAETVRRTTAVVTDDIEGMRLAVSHLVELGHTRIGHVAGPQHLSTGSLRRRGFESAMAAAGLAVAPFVAASAYNREAGEVATATLLDKQAVTAIVAANDQLALGAYRALEARGLSCPGEVSIVGHNDMFLMDMVDPPLTTVRIPHEQMGRQAARLLLARIEDKEQQVVTVTNTPTLVVRSSTAPPRSG